MSSLVMCVMYNKKGILAIVHIMNTCSQIMHFINDLNSLFHNQKRTGGYGKSS